MNRLLLTALALFLAASAVADNLLLAPTARHLPSGEIRMNAWGSDQFSYANVESALGQSWEAELSIDRFGIDRGRPTGRVAYYYLSPIADLTPGLAAGIKDLANATSDGRAAYVCATLNRAYPGNGRWGYLELTAGLTVGRRSGPLAGFRLPVIRNGSVLAEYDGLRFNEGLEFKAGSNARVGVVARGTRIYLSLGILI